MATRKELEDLLSPESLASEDQKKIAAEKLAALNQQEPNTVDVFCMACLKDLSNPKWNGQWPVFKASGNTATCPVCKLSGPVVLKEIMHSNGRNSFGSMYQLIAKVA